MEAKADGELVALARAGNKDAFGCLVERYQQMAGRIALGVMANEEIARDLAQEAMLQAYLSLDRLRDEQRFGSWLYGIVLNVCRSYVRDQQTDFYSLEAMAGGMRFETLSLAAAEPDPAEIAVERELHHVILAAVNTLSERDRVATLLFYYEQLSMREIAAILGVSLGAVKGRLHRARKQLRESLLPMYAGVKQERLPERRRRTMIKVSVADVLEQQHEGKARNVVVLLDEAGRRVLAIWIGAKEAQMIALELGKFQTPRPMTFDFMARMLQAADATLEEVRIETLKDEIFYAVAKMRRGDGAREVDARPSDALALALVTGSPILVAEEIFERAGIALPEGKTLQPGQGRASILPNVASELKTAFTPSAQPQPCPSPTAEQELLAMLLGE
jgi:RNA polymerase sigma factor (sigma-70 family)